MIQISPATSDGSTLFVDSFEFEAACKGLMPVVSKLISIHLGSEAATQHGR